MRELIAFSPAVAIRFPGARSDLYEELKRRWPQFFPTLPKLPTIEGTKDDQAVHEVIAFLREQGREPYWKKYPCCPINDPRLYQIEGRRVFDAADYAKTGHFAFFPEKVITNDASKDDEGRLRIKQGKINHQPIGRPFPWRGPLCKDHLKREMEAEHFIGLVFRRVELIGENADDEPVWSMESDREMPPLLDRLVCEDGTDYESAKALGCYVDDFYFPPLLRFPAESVQAMLPVDFANTKEQPHHKRGPDFPGDPMKKYEPYWIVSRRLRDWCIKRKLKIEYWPVVLE